MTTLKIPVDVWKLIIDKIEPEPYKLPNLIFINGVCIKTKYISHLTGPYSSDGNPIYIHFAEASQISTEVIKDYLRPKLYKLLKDMIDYSKQCW